MYFFLSSALTDRFILELRQYWGYHPQYPGLPDAIQGKFSFRERPQRGIIVRPGGGNHVRMSADNYKGVVNSYIYLAKYRDSPGMAVEWVREDAIAIQANGGRFPSQPGVYFIEITAWDEEEHTAELYVDPLVDITHEMVMMTDTTAGQLQKAPLAGTLRLYEMPARFMLHEGTNYTLGTDAEGKPDGSIVLSEELTGGRYLQADYRYPGDSIGPVTVRPLRAYNKIIPGAILAFGRRIIVGDKMAVVVQSLRHPASLEYGGRWELSMEFEVFARDVHEQREIADYSVHFIEGILRPRLSSEGVEILSMSLGGESEEIYDDNGDDYFYNASFSISVETEWSLFMPLNLWLRQTAPLTVGQARRVSEMTDEELSGETGDIKMLEGLGLTQTTDPFWTGKKGTFETIK